MYIENLVVFINSPHYLQTVKKGSMEETSSLPDQAAINPLQRFTLEQAEHNTPEKNPFNCMSILKLIGDGKVCIGKIKKGHKSVFQISLLSFHFSFCRS